MSARKFRRDRQHHSEREAKRAERLAKLTAKSAGLAAGATVLFAPAADAATLTVTNLNDSGAGSLRQAVIDANTPGPDQIVFQSGLTGAINLTSGDLNIQDGELTIQGPGAAQITVDGDGSDRIFDLYSFSPPGAGDDLGPHGPRWRRGRKWIEWRSDQQRRRGADPHGHGDPRQQHAARV